MFVWWAHALTSSQQVLLKTIKGHSEASGTRFWSIWGPDGGVQNAALRENSEHGHALQVTEM